VNHRTTETFWKLYDALPDDIRRLADKNFALLKRDPRHPSLRLKKVGSVWSVRIGSDYRALAVDDADGLTWIWIGKHSDYERLIR
jgi:mRNA-degrading endonuclease RelE of RelBE toxin-antitoxin system